MPASPDHRLIAGDYSGERQAARARLAGLIVAIAVTSGAWAGADLGTADRAFAAGENDEALTLYEELLAEDSSNVHALVRSAMLLSWDRRYNEAVARYDRALTLQPDHPKAQLERAKVLSWDRRFNDAAAAFRVLAKRDPADVDARLGLARALSWSGKQPPARLEYQGILDRDPENAYAMVGVAQTYAWSGNPKTARTWYTRALETRPEMKEALLGLAYLDLAAGDLTEAALKAGELESRLPDDGDVQELQRAVGRARAPWVRGSFDHLEDTDDNDLTRYGVESGWVPWARIGLTFGVARYDMEDPSGTASVDALYGVLGWRLAAKHDLKFRLGGNRREDSTGNTSDIAVGGLTYTWDFLPTWQLRASARRNSFIYSVGILDGPGNIIEVYDLFVEGRPVERWRVAAGAGTWDISDGNRRQNAEAGAWYGWSPGRTRIEAGYQFRYLNYDEDLDSGYFDPQNFTANLAQFRAWGNFGSSRAYYNARLEAGFQSFTQSGVEVSNDQVFGVHGLAGVPVGHGLAFEAFASYSNFALQSATGFESRQFGFLLRWRPGGR